VVVLHAMLLSARMFAVYFFAILGAAYLLQRPLKAVRIRTLLIIVLIVLGIVWAGATLRDGGRKKAETGLGYFHSDTQQYVRDTLMQGYFGADFNNALVYLNCKPMGEYVYTTMFRTVALKLGYTFTFNSCFPEMDSAYGTMNTVALWWEDLGWWAALVAIVVGAWLTFLYIAAREQQFPSAPLLFLISYPGVLSAIRINYFFLTIYVVPLLFLVTALSLRQFGLWTLSPVGGRRFQARRDRQSQAHA
jgi:hypothetical protein